MSPEADEQRIENQAARQELPRATHDFLQRQEQRRKVFARALLVGLLAGALALALTYSNYKVLRRGVRDRERTGTGP